MNDEKSKTAARAALTQYIHTKKLRRTPERYAILDKIFDIAEHFSIDMLYVRLMVWRPKIMFSYLLIVDY